MLDGLPIRQLRKCFPSDRRRHRFQGFSYVLYGFPAMNDSIATTETIPTIDTEELLTRCLGRIELMERIIDRFVGSSQAEIDSLEAALQLNDSQEIARLAHKLSGTAITVSAKSLASAAKALEQQAIDQKADTLAPLVNNVTREFASIRSRYASARTEAAQ